MALKQVSDGGPDGTAIGQSATDKVGFHGVVPVALSTVATVPAATAATSSTPFGYSQVQADAVITYIRALDTYLRAKGLIS